MTGREAGLAAPPGRVACSPVTAGTRVSGHGFPRARRQYPGYQAGRLPRAVGRDRAWTTAARVRSAAGGHARPDELRYEEPRRGETGYNEPLDDDRGTPSWAAAHLPTRSSLAAGPAGASVAATSGASPTVTAPSTVKQPGGIPDAARVGPDGSGPGLQGSAGTPGWQPALRPAAGPGTDAARPDLAGYLAAPTAQVGVLAPPAIRRLEEPAGYGTAATGPQRAVAGASQVLAPAVRPGHGLDGPEITSSWPAQPQADEQDSFAEFWAEDDDDDYTGLFPGEDGDSGRRTRGTARRTGRRRGRSNDHRLWLALGGVLVTAVAAIVGILKFELPSHSGPVHTMVTPAKIGSYLRTVDMERQTNVSELRNEVIKMSSGQASDVKSAVYESGNSAAGNTEQIVMFIGGHLANAAPASSIGSFRQNFANAAVVSAGSLGGQAACVQEAAARRTRWPCVPGSTRQLRGDRLAHHGCHRAGPGDAHDAPLGGAGGQEVRTPSAARPARPGPLADGQPGRDEHDRQSHRDQARHLGGGRRSVG